ncbi:hypothetical protein [Mogibacterium sp.]
MFDYDLASRVPSGAKGEAKQVKYRGGQRDRAKRKSNSIRHSSPMSSAKKRRVKLVSFFM